MPGGCVRIAVLLQIQNRMSLFHGYRWQVPGLVIDYYRLMVALRQKRLDLDESFEFSRESRHCARHPYLR